MNIVTKNGEKKFFSNMNTYWVTVNEPMRMFNLLTLINARGVQSSSFIGESQFLHNQTSVGPETSL